MPEGVVHKGELDEPCTERRWNIELESSFMHQDDPRHGRAALSHASDDREKELWVYLLAYNLIRLLMAEAA